MTDKVQKIKDWISKTQDSLMDAQGNFEYPEHEGAYHILCNLDAYINTLQEEPKKCLFAKDNYTSEDRKVLCEDCDEDCEYAKKVEPVSGFMNIESMIESYKQRLISQVMVKYAVECQVEEGGMCPAVESIPVLSNTDMIQLPKDKFEVGDKVKLIIIKQQED